MALFFEKRQDEQVYHLCQRLAEAVDIIMSPNSSRERRMEATRVCEEFKNNSIYLTRCGIHLFSSHPNFIVKHFGLQLIQHAVKLNWNEMTPEEKDNLKLLSLDFIQGCTGPLIDEPTYLKDGIAKFTVEIMKREWPQQWPDVIKNLSEISQKGHSQLFTVLRTLLCLAEEANKIGGDLPPVRRKEIYSSLCTILEELFKFFVETLQRTAEKIKETKTQPGDTQHREVLLHKVLAESVLTTLCGYVEWVNIKFLVQDKAILLQTLCLLLQEEDLRLKAGECLEAIAGRKGPIVDRQPILILFSLDAISLIFASISRNTFNDNFDDEKHVFLKRVCSILCLLGQTQLASLWGTPGCPEVDEPTHFHIYLEALISLHMHKNVLITDMINKTWKIFLRNSFISKNPTFCSFIPKILEISKTKMSRALHPLLNTSAILYPDVDFGSMAEKMNAWTSLRASTKDIVQEITSLYPSDAFLHAATWLLKLTNTPPPTTQVTETSPEYLEWECLTSFASSVLNKLFSNEPSYIQELMALQVRMENSTIAVSELSKKCIESLVQYETKGLLIQHLIMMCYEPFIPFLHFHYELLLTVIHKIFALVSYESPDHDPESEFKAYEYRRAAGSIWIRLCLAHNKVLINIIDDLTRHIQTSFERDDRSMERSFLAEGLVVLSNGYGNFEKQSKYLNELIASTKKIWMSAEVENALSSPESFITFIGLDNPDADDNQVQKQRYTLNMCLRVIHAFLKRVEPPKDLQEQINGGFKTRPEDVPINPGACAVLPMLSNMFHLSRVLSSIWHPSVRVKIPPYYQPALGMHESEKAAIFGIDGRGEPMQKPKENKTRKTNVDAMKTFLFRLNEQCALALSDCSRLEGGYFSAPLLGQHLVTYVIEPWRHLPNYRLRNFIRSFFKMFCRVCPPAYYESAVVPVVVATLTLMIEHLNKEWEVVRNREIVRPHLANIEDAEIDEEEEQDKDNEVTEDQLVHLLTKNFLEAFFAICTMKRPSVNANLKNIITEETPIPDNSDDILEELPKYLLKHPATCKVFLFVPFMALQWPDTSGFVKAAKLCVPFIKQVAQNPPTGVAMATEMFEQILTLCLKGLQLMGHHVEIQSQLVRNACIIYDTLRPLFPSLKNIILQVPNVDTTVLNNYDLALLSDNDQSEKQKRKIFRGLLSGLIGKEIGKMFQNDITILNLPAMPVVKKSSSPSLLDTADSNDLGLVRLFEPTLRAETLT